MTINGTRCVKSVTKCKPGCSNVEWFCYRKPSYLFSFCSIIFTQSFFSELNIVLNIYIYIYMRNNRDSARKS